MVGCATGLRLFGTSAVEAERLHVTLSGCEFFEPSEEFGITKALVKCEAELRPKLPSTAEPLTATLQAVFSDTEMLIARLEEDGEEGGMLLVMARDEQAFDVAKRRRG